MTHRLPCPRIPHARAVALAACLAAPLAAQRPAPPRDWSVDTTGTRPVATRKGGMLSTATRVELVGPFATDAGAADLAAWLDAAADGDAATIGTARPEATTRAAAATIGGVRTWVTARQVRTTGYDRWLGYAVVDDATPGAPRFLVRLATGDGLTYARVVRGGVEAMLPYLREPTAAMRALPVSALRTLAAAPGRAASPSAAAAQAAAPATARSRTVATPRARTSADWGPPVAPGAGGKYMMHLEYVSGGSGGIYSMVGYWLRDDGWAVRDPDVPATGFDAVAHRRAHPDDWVRWRALGPRRIELTEADGKPDADDQWMPIRPLAAGARLEGGWRATSSFATPDLTTATASVSQVMIFRPDGSFTTRVGSIAQSAGATAAGARADGGRYAVIDPTTVELRWNDGRVVRVLALFGGDAGKPATVMILAGMTYYDL